MAGTGPPPKMNPQRQNARVGPLQLPAEGRGGTPPKWPLGGRVPVVWRDLWSTPQAVAWERFGWTRVVARYCRVLAQAEELDKDALAEARQLEDRLGLTPKAMRLLLWTVVEDETAERRRKRKPRERPRAVDAGA